MKGKASVKMVLTEAWSLIRGSIARVLIRSADEMFKLPVPLSLDVILCG